MIAIGSDHAGFALKEQIKRHLQGQGIEVKDFGTYDEASCNYPDYAFPVAKCVAEGAAERGILVCGTGIGMSICANKIKGIRCALCTSEFTATVTRQHNDANVMAIGARVTDPVLALRMVDLFLQTPFEEGRHQKRLDLISKEENHN